jgi:uncharacterized protein (UPF0548 family)
VPKDSDEQPARGGGDLAQRPLSYQPVGATISSNGFHATGFRTSQARARLGEGPERWAAACEAVLRWEVKTRSGFSVVGGSGSEGVGTRVSVGDRYWLVARLVPLRVREPVQVVAVIDEADRVGFAYGTLVGHPVSGEEAFVVERDRTGTVWIDIRALTRPAQGLWRFAYPCVLVAQRIYRRRYLRALADRR